MGLLLRVVVVGKRGVALVRKRLVPALVVSASVLGGMQWGFRAPRSLFDGCGPSIGCGWRPGSATPTRRRLVLVVGNG